MAYKILAAFLIFSLLFICIFSYLILVPYDNFPVDTTFVVEPKDTGEGVIKHLKEQEFIQSIFVAKVVNKFLGTNIQDGEYVFDRKLSLLELMLSLRVAPNKIRIAIPEGFTKRQVADRLEKNLQSNGKTNFDKKYFLENVEEGYIFPETYFFNSFSSSEDVLLKFKQEREGILSSLDRLPTKEEIILASILEREAKSEKDMRIVSGILLNRIDIGMPLQVDATVLYGQGIWKERVFYKDLQHESDYNTYQNKGLPPGAISNPGLIAIRAAMYPATTSYIYYLTGKDGKMYYAKTFREHVNNKNRYLK